MNKPPISQKIQIINVLVAGSNLRRLMDRYGVVNTITKLIIDIPLANQLFKDEAVRVWFAKGSKLIKFGSHVNEGDE